MTDMAAIQPDSDPVIRIEKISKEYNETWVVRDVSIAVKKGETVAIIGPSGSGKTTVLRCINFLVPYDLGKIYLGDELVGYRERETGGLVRRPEREIDDIRRRIGMVFQRYVLFPHLSVLRNLTIGPVKVLGKSREEAEADAIAALRTVNLSDKINAFPHEMSGGQQQRAAIARALCMKPEVLLFDEVTSALDPELVDEVLYTIKELAMQKYTMILVTHEMRFARDVADRVVFMEGGRVRADQDAKEFFRNPPDERISSFIGRYV